MALTKRLSEILDFLEKNGPAKILTVANAFFINYKTASYHLIKLKKMKEVHCTFDEIKDGIHFKIFKAGPGEDVQFLRNFSKTDAKKNKSDFLNKREKKEIDQIRAEALANAQMLLSRPNTPFGWLIERSNSI